VTGHGTHQSRGSRGPGARVGLLPGSRRVPPDRVAHHAGPTATTPAPTTAPPSGPPSSTRPAPSSTSKPPTTPAPPFPRSLLGQDIERIPTAQRVVALTFDAGANADAVGSILTTLAQQHITATFFLTGDFVADFPDAARRIAAAGHRIGNHSVNHPHFTSLSDADIRAQLSATAATIHGTTGANPAPLFRFPYGDRDARTIAVVNAAGYVPIRWTVDSLGWQGTMNGSRGAAFVTQRVVAAATAGEIVLMHVGSNPDDHSMLDAQALPDIIAALRAQGYGFASLDALLVPA
jgi:peptidoglycan/xylan/chitin deacetylase (PgdA/CDA1 family)